MSTPPRIPSSAAQRSVEELRTEVRYPVGQPAVLRADSGLYVVTILDVSRSGMRVSCSKEFASGTNVHVRYAELEVPGEIRYARKLETGEFHLGIQVAPGRESELLRRLKIG